MATNLTGLEISNLFAERDRLRKCLRTIIAINGTLTDEAIERVGGVGDARSLAIRVVTMRRLAREALNEPDAKD